MNKELYLVGLNYKTAPVEVRERFALTDPQVLERGVVPLDGDIRECVILSTCNRVELLAVARDLVQMAERVVFPKGEAKEDWAVIRALSERVGHTLPYDTLDQLRAKLMADHPTFGRIDYVAPAATFDVGSLGAKGDLGEGDFVSPVADPYLSNPIARASVTMAELSAERIAPVSMAAE